MAKVQTFTLPPTALIPNSPRPLLHYPARFANSSSREVYDAIQGNGWHVQWVYRYGQDQKSHYHSSAHECMVVLSGSARIRFGVADLPNGEADALAGGAAHEHGGVEIEANLGDVFVLPAGVAHKTFAAQPRRDFKLLSPGNGHGAAEDMIYFLDDPRLDGFTMMGAYPRESSEWDFATGGESEGRFRQVWAVAKPRCDPVMGEAEDGLCQLWD